MQSQLTVMYPSNSSLNANDLISYPIQPFWSRPFSIESNPTSKQETHCTLPPPPPLSIFQFPSPFEDNEIFLEQHHDFLLHHHQSLAEAVNVNMEMEVSINSKIPGKSEGIATEQIPRKRSSKRDRHSKIKTARGLRDRRMRLSLEVAKRFFGLQDMLGFDKASKTVEWLLNQAKVEIKQLAREKNIHHPSCRSGGGGGAKSASSTSECEGVSSLDEVAASGNQEQKGGVVKRRIKLSRKSAFKPVARESREKARERARERTKQIKMRRLAANEPKQCNEATTNHNMNRLGGSWNPFETVEESAGTQSQSLNPSLDVLAEAEEPSSQAKEHHLGTVEDIAHEDSLVIMSKWSPTMIFNSLNNSGILHEHQFAEFQSLGKPWEAYNNHNI